MNSFKTKNGKLARLIVHKRPNDSKFHVPIINLSDVTLKDSEKEILKFGLHHSFLDRSKYTKQNLAIEMESLVDITKEKVSQENKELYHELLVKYTNIFTKNIYSVKDYTYKNLKDLIDNPNIVLLEGDKDTSVVIMKKCDYVNKMNEMIDKGIRDGTYMESNDTTIEDLKHFKDFISNHFKKHPKYKKMLPASHRPARMYGSAKTHKFENYDDITAENLKLRPIMDQSGTMVYNTAQVIAEYLKPLDDSKYVIKDTLTFPNVLTENKIKEDEEDISYDVVSLFTNVPIEDTIEYIINEIYVKKRLKPICTKLIMKRMLKRLTSDCLFTINNRLLKQIDGCAMGSPLSVVLSGIFMSKLEKQVVYPTKPILYKRYVDDVFNRKKKNEEDTLLPKLNAYHENIKFTVESNLSKFLDTKLQLQNGNYSTSVNRNRKLPMHWSSNVPKKFKRNIINNDLHRAQKISSNFSNEVKEIKQKYNYADFPRRYVDSVIKDFNEKKAERPVVNDILDQETKPFVPIKIPFCDQNEKIARHFLKKLNDFTSNKFKFTIVWQTRKIKTLFNLKDKVKYKACVIYKGTIDSKPDIAYIGETKLIADSRWKQHQDPNHDSAPSKYLRENPSETFSWEILCMSSSDSNKRRIHEALYINKYKPSLNTQVTHKNLVLFRSGVT